MSEANCPIHKTILDPIGTELINVHVQLTALLQYSLYMYGDHNTYYYGAQLAYIIYYY